MSRQFLMTTQPRVGTSASSSQQASSAAMRPLKRKFSGSSDDESVSVASLSFPFLSDEEPAIHTLRHFHPSTATFSNEAATTGDAEAASFFCVSKALFALTDESRDRGSAKIANITVTLRHPTFQSGAASSRSAASTSRDYVSQFKIDGRKSFSNAPFKKYYTRAIHAAWFAEHVQPQQTAEDEEADAELDVLSSGRVLMLLSQRQGRPNGKGFTGLKHDPASITPKHPLLCLASNSVEYTVAVFVNRSHSRFAGETDAMASIDWQQCEVSVEGSFEAGECTLDPMPFPGSAAVKTVRALAAASQRNIVQPSSVRRQAASAHLPSALSMSSLVTADSYSSARTTSVSPQSQASSTPSAGTPSSLTASDASQQSDSEGYSTPVHEAAEVLLEYHEDQAAPLEQLQEDITLPDSDEVPQSWIDTYPISVEDIQQQAAATASSSSSSYQQSMPKCLPASFVAAEFPSSPLAPFLSSEVRLEERQTSLQVPALHMLVQPPSASPVAGVNSFKRARLSIDEHAAPLFTVSMEWNAASPQLHQSLLPHATPITPSVFAAY